MLKADSIIIFSTWYLQLFAPATSIFLIWNLTILVFFYPFPPSSGLLFQFSVHPYLGNLFFLYDINFMSISTFESLLLPFLKE